MSEIRGIYPSARSWWRRVSCRRSPRGAHRTGGTYGTGCACGALGTLGTHGAGGPYRAPVGHPQELVRIAGDAPGVIHQHLVELPLVGHQLSGVVGSTLHKGHRHRPGRRTRGRRTGGRTHRPAAGRTGRRAGIAAGTLGTEVTTLVTLHSTSFLRISGSVSLEGTLALVLLYAPAAPFAPVSTPNRKKDGAQRENVVNYTPEL